MEWNITSKYQKWNITSHKWNKLKCTKVFPEKGMIRKTQEKDRICQWPYLFYGNVRGIYLSMSTYVYSKDRISASADGGPRSRVCARETLRSAPHRH